MTSRKPVFIRDAELELRHRITYLEGQVGTLRERLDELRRAKSYIVLKREKEVIQVGHSFSDRRRRKSQAKPVGISDEELQRLKKAHADEIAFLKQQFQEKLAEEESKPPPDCGHQPEIEKLLYKISQQESEMACLSAENEALKMRVDDLVSELSVKEAKWCEAEEKYKLQIRKMKPWEEEYKLWMRMMESKLSETQHAQAFLRSVLHKEVAKDETKNGDDTLVDEELKELRDDIGQTGKHDL